MGRYSGKGLIQFGRQGAAVLAVLLAALLVSAALTFATETLNPLPALANEQEVSSAAAASSGGSADKGEKPASEKREAPQDKPASTDEGGSSGSAPASGGSAAPDSQASGEGGGGSSGGDGSNGASSGSSASASPDQPAGGSDGGQENPSSESGKTDTPDGESASSGSSAPASDDKGKPDGKSDGEGGEKADGKDGEKADDKPDGKSDGKDGEKADGASDSGPAKEPDGEANEKPEDPVDETADENDEEKDEEGDDKAKDDADKTVRIVKIEFKYLLSPDAGDEGHTSSNAFKRYDSSNPPTISIRGGKLRLCAVITFERANGKRYTVTADEADAHLRWEIKATYADGSSSDIAKVKSAYPSSNMQDCLVTALGSGNGSVVIRCIPTAYSKFGHKDITVKIEGNEPKAETDGEASKTDDQKESDDSKATNDEKASKAAVGAKAAKTALRSQTREALTVQSAHIVYKNPSTGRFVCAPYGDTGAPSAVVELYGPAHFDVELTYSDGSKKLASEAGLTTQWSLSNNIYNSAAVVEMAQDGTMTIRTVSSKLVQLRATVDGCETACKPVYVNLLNSNSIVPETKNILSAKVVFAGEGSEIGLYEGRDGDTEQPIPVIAMRNGKLTLGAVLAYIDSDGAVSYDSEPFTGFELIWQVVRFFDVNHEETATMLAKALSSNGIGTVEALNTGDGWAIVRFVSDAYPNFTGQEMLVQILGNQATSEETVAANTITDAQILYYDKGSGSYKEYPSSTVGTTPTVIDEPYGSTSFDVKVNFADGSSARASELGLAVDWTPKAITYRGKAVASLTPSGTLKALRVRNQNPSISPQVIGISTSVKTAYIRITNNDPSMRPSSDKLTISANSNYWIGASQKPDDPSKKWYWRALPGSSSGGYTVPLVLSGTPSESSCKLTARVRWSNVSSTFSEEEDGGVREWTVVSSVGSDGSACAPLVTVSSDGTVRATGAGSGVSTIACTVKVPYYDENGKVAYFTTMGTYRVAAYTNDRYAKSLILLNESRKPIYTSSMVLPKGKNRYQFYAEITYVEYDPAVHSVAERKVVVPWDEIEAEGLEWEVYRREDRAQEESYSKIDSKKGTFQALSGFARGYVYANLKGASFTGSDLGAGIMVIAADSIEHLGKTDSLTVKIYHTSDYVNHGDSAPVAKELTLTRAQLGSMADYTTWYTFQKRNDNFATVYASGLSMNNFLMLCGVDPARLVSIAFVGTDGYFAERHSASYVLGTQYRYLNYYYAKDLPGLVSSQTVAPMIALSYYMKNNAGYEDASSKNDAGSAGYSYMTEDSTIRVIFGMTGFRIRNANQSIHKVHQVTIIVEDGTFPEEEEEKPDPEKPDDPKEDDGPGKGEEGKQGNKDDSSNEEGKNEGGKGASNPEDGKGDEGTGKGTGSNVNDNGDGRKKGGAVAAGDDPDASATAGNADAKGDKESKEGGAQGSNPSDAKDKSSSKSETDVSDTITAEIVTGDKIVEKSGSLYAHELSERRLVIPPAELDRVWWVLVALGALLALIVGAVISRYRYTLDRIDGARIHT